MQAESESSENDNEKEQIYLKVIQNIKNTLDSTAKLQLDAKEASINLKSKLETRLNKETELRDELNQFKKDVISKAISSTRENNCLNESILADFEREETKKMEEINTMRLSFIKLKMNVQNLEKKMKSKEKMDEDLDILGFEQLQSENDVLKNKQIYCQTEIERFNNNYASNTDKIKRVKNEIETMQESISDEMNEVKTLDKEISSSGRELSKLLDQYNDLQKNFTMQSNVASNKIVHDHFISSKEEVKQLTSTLENLKVRYLELNDKKRQNRFSV